MHEIMVREETPDDVRAIDVVHLSAFQGEAEAQLLANLRAEPNFNPALSLVAELNGRIVGHILLTPVSLVREGWQTEVYALGPMAVVPSQSHRGIGSALVKEAVERVRSMDGSLIVVAGHPDYYAHCGFEPVTDKGLSSNLSLPEDALTALELKPGTLQGGGQVEYPEAFKAIF